VHSAHASCVRGLIGQATDSGSATYSMRGGQRDRRPGWSNVPSDAIGLQILTTHAAATAMQMFGFYSALL